MKTVHIGICDNPKIAGMTAYSDTAAIILPARNKKLLHNASRTGLSSATQNIPISAKQKTVFILKKRPYKRI